MRLVNLLVILAALGLVPAATAQTPSERPVPARLTLEEALARAVETSHRLAELRAREAAATAVVDQREAEDMPTLAVLAGYQRTNHVDEFGFPQPDGSVEIFYPDVPDNWHSRLDMLWPIYTGGRTKALERAADAERQATGKDLESAQADLRLETTRAFWALVTAGESVRVVQEAVARIEAQLHDVKARFDAGFLPPNDVLTVETTVSQQRTLLIEAENRRDATRAELSRLISAPLDSAFEPDASLELPGPVPNPLGEGPTTRPGGQALPAAADFNLAVKTARADRADRQALVFRADAATDRIAAAHADALPMVAIGAGYDYARPNPKIFPRQDEWKTSWDVGVNVSWTLWNGGRTAADVAEAKSLATAARERLAEFDTVIGLEVRQRQLDLDSARAQVKTASDAVKSSIEARRVVQARFDAGVASNTDLLDAQQDQLQSELERTRALANVRLAEARLARALGR